MYNIVQLCCCVRFLVVAGNSSQNENMFLQKNLIGLLYYDPLADVCIFVQPNTLLLRIFNLFFRAATAFDIFGTDNAEELLTCGFQFLFLGRYLIGVLECHQLTPPNKIVLFLAKHLPPIYDRRHYLHCTISLIMKRTL